MRIEDDDFIDDTQTDALVGRQHAVDWLCLPRYASASCSWGTSGTGAGGWRRQAKSARAAPDL